MIDLIRNNQDKISTLCRAFSVQRLELFGSAADGTFDAQTSDLDFLVVFGEHPELNAFHQFFGFQAALADLLGRKVDLTDANAMKNPHFIADVNRSRESLYAA